MAKFGLEIHIPVTSSELHDALCPEDDDHRTQKVRVQVVCAHVVSLVVRLFVLECMGGQPSAPLLQLSAECAVGC